MSVFCLAHCLILSRSLSLSLVIISLRESLVVSLSLTCSLSLSLVLPPRCSLLPSLTQSLSLTRCLSPSFSCSPHQTRDDSLSLVLPLTRCLLVFTHCESLSVRVRSSTCLTLSLVDLSLPLVVTPTRCLYPTFTRHPSLTRSSLLPLLALESFSSASLTLIHSRSHCCLIVSLTHALSLCLSNTRDNLSLSLLLVVSLTHGLSRVWSRSLSLSLVVSLRHSLSLSSSLVITLTRCLSPPSHCFCLSHAVSLSPSVRRLVYLTRRLVSPTRYHSHSLSLSYPPLSLVIPLLACTRSFSSLSLIHSRSHCLIVSLTPALSVALTHAITYPSLRYSLMSR